MSANRRLAMSPAAELQAAVEREVRIAEQTRPLRAALKQTEHYTDLRGVPHPLTQMSGAEALLVLALLERHAETLHRGELGEQLLVAAAREGRERHQAIEAHHQLASLTATGWLRATPLHRALTKRASQ
jgi:hypothetical protein